MYKLLAICVCLLAIVNVGVMGSGYGEKEAAYYGGAAPHVKTAPLEIKSYKTAAPLPLPAIKPKDEPAPAATFKFSGGYGKW